MEVHHEHFHEPPGKGEKPWKHYAMEFFMLFLAVSLGFFTENLRDHIVENERAKEMAIGLFYDLQNDSTQLNEAIERKELFITELNSLIITLSDKDVKNKVTQLTYYQASFLLEIDVPIPSKANLDQLINSGSLRYFKNKKLVSEISKWDNIIAFKFLERYQTDQNRLIEEIRSISRVFYPVIIDSMRTFSYRNFYNNQRLGADTLNAFGNTPASLITYDEADINEVIGWASERKKNAIIRSTSFYPEQLEHIKKLMHDLNQEFDIKKEK